LPALDGEAVLSALDSSFVPSVVGSVWRRGEDPGVVSALLLPDGDSPRVALLEGLALAVADALAAGLAYGLAETEAVGNALAAGEAVAPTAGDALILGEAVAVVAPAVVVVAPVVVLVPAAPVTLVDVPTPTPAETP
jgi:hypothetical protein